MLERKETEKKVKQEENSQSNNLIVNTKTKQVHHKQAEHLTQSSISAGTRLLAQWKWIKSCCRVHTREAGLCLMT